MTTRSEKLSRLTIGSPCATAWDGMVGDERRRHCLECGRDVHDFAMRTPREIAALVEASRGHLCARITRDGLGRLVTADPGPLVPLSVHGPRRASPVAAAVVGGLLGLGAAAARPAPTPAAASGSAALATPEAPPKPERAQSQRPAAAGAVLRGRITDQVAGDKLPGVTVVARNTFDGQEHMVVSTADGTFAFDGLAAGVYDLTAQLAGFTIAPQSDILLHPAEQRELGLQAQPAEIEALGGAIAVTQEPLRQEFSQSELVVRATAGPSQVVKQGNGYVEVDTEFVVDATFKGKAPRRTIRIVHADGESTPEEARRFAPGTQVLAFLKLRDGETGGRAVYESADYSFGLRTLPAAELAAYGRRLTALARLPGQPHPAALVEWLVGTVEEPLTRSEAVGEIHGALGALRELAKGRGISPEQAAGDLRAVANRFQNDGGAFEQEPPPALLAAYLSDRHKARLSAAFQATPQLTEADVTLFLVVHPWAGDAARSWLAHKLAAQGTEPAGLSHQSMSQIAQELGNDTLQGYVQAADEEIERYESSFGEQWPEGTLQLVEQKTEAVDRELRHRFAKALGGTR